MDDVLELDNQDKRRIDRNIRALRRDDIPYLEYMTRIPVNSLTKILSEKEIINKMLVDYLISSSASLMISSSMFLVGDLLDKINKKYNTDSILTLEDKTLILDIINKLFTLSELDEYSQRIESVNVCLWVLGLIDDINSYTKCNIEEINKIIFKYKSYDELQKSCRMRSKDEILSKFDLITRYYWAFREVGKQELAGKLNENIVNIQNETFEIITSYSYDSLRDKNIRIEYDKDDLEFNFEIPGHLNFERLSDHSRELLALKSDDGNSRLVFTDLGNIEQEEFDTKVEKNIKLFVKGGFTLLGDYVLHSTLLDEKIVRIVIRRGNTSLNSYYFFVSNHLIRMDSLIEAFIDSSNYYENTNSKNTNQDLDIIFSIREVEY